MLPTIKELNSSSRMPINRKLKLSSAGFIRLLILGGLFWFLIQFRWITQSWQNNNNYYLSKKPLRILYVHIGKTGGEWIKSQLSVICKTRKNPQVKKACLEKFQTTSSSQLSLQTVGYFHVHNLFPRNGHALASHYLFSIRHPLTRLVSWYVYNHPRSCDPRENNSPSCKTSDWKTKFFTCFPTLEEFGKQPSENNDECGKVLWDGWYGRVNNVKEPNHLYWNYQVSMRKFLYEKVIQQACKD